MLLKKPAPEVGTTFESGGVFPVTGYYSYVKHVDSDGGGCYVSPDVRGGMLFTKGEAVPKLVGCPHAVIWVLDARYEPA